MSFIHSCMHSFFQMLMHDYLFQQNEKATYTMGKMFASHTSDKGLKCKIYKEHIQLNNNINNNNINNNNNSNSHHYHLIQEWTKDLTRYIQRKYSYGKLIHIKVLNISKNQGMPIKTTVKYHPTSSRMDIIKKSRDNRCCQGHEEKRTLLELILTGTKTMENRMEVPEKSKKMEQPHDASSLPW